MSNKPDQQPKNKGRSPAYPVSSLPKALELTKKIWESQRKHEAHIDATLKAMGYSSRNGAALRSLAALGHYGLIDETGSGDQRKIRVSERAQDIIHLEDSDPRKAIALREAALSPAVHSALWERYGKIIPDDAAIRPYLIRDKNYNEEIVPLILENYRTSFETAKLDKLDDGMARPNEDKVKKELSKVPQPPSTTVNAAELPILVGESGVARIPFPMTNEDFDLLIGTLNLWKKRIVKELTPADPKPANIDDIL